jgi:DNA invertase Pin-like site-specific DNA recombinase
MTFISQLMDSRTRFVCCDQPDANELTIHIFAALAQWERQRISERIKDAHRAKRLREPLYRFGTPVVTLTDETRLKAKMTISRGAREDSNWRHAFHYIKDLRSRGRTFREIADELNKERYTTRSGGQFYPAQVWRIYNRFRKKKNVSSVNISENKNPVEGPGSKS